MDEDDLSLKFACPVCGATCQEQCHVQKGVRRSEPHWERLELANDALLDSIGESHESHDLHPSTKRSEIS
jgi:hypothetical protein